MDKRVLAKKFLSEDFPENFKKKETKPEEKEKKPEEEKSSKEQKPEEQPGQDKVAPEEEDGSDERKITSDEHNHHLTIVAVRHNLKQASGFFNDKGELNGKKIKDDLQPAADSFAGGATKLLKQHSNEIFQSIINTAAELQVDPKRATPEQITKVGAAFAKKLLNNTPREKVAPQHIDFVRAIAHNALAKARQVMQLISKPPKDEPTLSDDPLETGHVQQVPEDKEPEQKPEDDKKQSSEKPQAGVPDKTNGQPPQFQKPQAQPATQVDPNEKKPAPAQFGGKKEQPTQVKPEASKQAAPSAAGKPQQAPAKPIQVPVKQGQAPVKPIQAPVKHDQAPVKPEKEIGDVKAKVGAVKSYLDKNPEAKQKLVAGDPAQRKEMVGQILKGTKTPNTGAEDKPSGKDIGVSEKPNISPEQKPDYQDKVYIDRPPARDKHDDGEDDFADLDPKFDNGGITEGVSKNSRFQQARGYAGGGSVYTCHVCKKQTRETGHGEAELDLCAYCLLCSYAENSVYDGNTTIAQYNVEIARLNKLYNRADPRWLTIMKGRKDNL